MKIKGFGFSGNVALQDGRIAFHSCGFLHFVMQILDLKESLINEKKAQSVISLVLWIQLHSFPAYTHFQKTA